MENQNVEMTAMEQIKEASDLLAQAIERAVGEMQDKVSAHFTALKAIKQGLKDSKAEMTELENVVSGFGEAMVITGEDLAERVADIDDVLYVIAPEDYEDEDEGYEEEDEPYEEDEEDYEDEDNEAIEEDEDSEADVLDGYYEDEDSEADEVVED